MTDRRGAYTADRAAGLSGVPVSTLHWWARHDVLPPSVSPSKIKLWSYSDLMAARIIYWLRHTKEADDGHTVPASTMPAVRQALAMLDELNLSLWSEDGGPSVRVDRAGTIHVTSDPSLERVRDQQRAIPGEDSELGFIGPEEELDVLSPFTTRRAEGPDLRCPREHLRIVPGKIGGSPHVVKTRLESQALGALAQGGLPTARIYELYPQVQHAAIDEAISLEQQITRNVHPAFAA